MYLRRFGKKRDHVGTMHFSAHLEECADDEYLDRLTRDRKVYMSDRQCRDVVRRIHLWRFLLEDGNTMLEFDIWPNEAAAEARRLENWLIASNRIFDLFVQGVGIEDVDVVDYSTREEMICALASLR